MNMKKIFSIGPLLITFILACSHADKKSETSSADTSQTEGVPQSVQTEAITEYSKTLPLDKIKLPAGFTISIYAEVDNARSMAISPSGTIYVGNRNGDKVYAIKDTNGDFVADKKWTLASGLDMPNGVAFKDGDLYVAEATRILKFSG